MRELILTSRSQAPSSQDGLLPPEWPLPRLPGLAVHSPTSSSRVKVFLECPYSFFLRNILYWEEPPSAPDTREIGQPDYGSLLHRAVEAFFSLHGGDFTTRRRTLEDWKKEARTIVDREFAEFVQNYPLLSGRVREQQRKRLARDFLRLLEHEWKNRAGLEFRAAEFPFGFPDPIPLDLAGRRFFVRGYIDRLDVARGGILVRDVKSGKAVPREKNKAGPSPVVDAQLAVYALVMNRLHQVSPRKWPRVGGAAYLYPDPRGVAERAFEADLDDLLNEGGRWLSLAADMIEGRAFPRTADPEDCTYCPFVPVCGDQSHGAAAEKLKNAGPLVQRFLSIKGVEEEVVEEPEG